MCGIFAIFNNHYDSNIIKHNFEKGKNRGPENSKLIKVNDSLLGFHRLAINGHNDENSNQPFNINGIYLICNGEIYNWKELYNIINIKPNSKSDCEVIIHLYKKYGIEQALQMLDGVFAFALFDTINNKFFIARDTFGVRPLFIKEDYKRNPISFEEMSAICFASELKQLSGLDDKQNIKQFTPGTYSVYNINNLFTMCLVKEKVFSKPLSIPNNFSNIFSDIEIENECLKINKSLVDAVKKRVDNTERKIACLLSGGLDSSLIAALVNKYKKTKEKLSTWSIGLKGSEDLKYAKIVANHIGSDHHEIVVTEKHFLSFIETVIYNIESYDTTTIRASIGNWLISKYIKENSDCKVVFNGDGSDEVCGGYMYFHLSPDSIEFDKECRKLLNNIHYFDVLRSDRSISSHGLEARTPFLDKNFVDTYLSINPNMRNHAFMGKCEKYLLRTAFSNCNLLPDCVLWRTKEAFSDGVSSDTKSWFSILQDHIKTNIFKLNNSNFLNSQQEHYIYNTPKTYEQLYYRMVFESSFNMQSYIIPYFWMPNFTNATDASARTLDVYKKHTKKEEKGCYNH
jgi:asparagine synthase (glutamine-hydrolysing)